MMRCSACLSVFVFALSLNTVSLPHAYAQETVLCRYEREEERGFGGTGITTGVTDVLARLVADPAAERGFGGTGREDETERGFGGTGVIAADETGERGFGGTGIIGVVTGFASICVNGYEVEVTPDTVIDVEGLAATDADIRLGQVVAVEAYPENGSLVASTVSIQVAAAGPVDFINGDSGELRVAGQAIETNSFGGSADISNIETGDWVVASGLRRGDDVIAATSVVPLAQTGAQVVISGPVRETESGLAIGSVTVDLDTVTVGDVAVVRGVLRDGQIEPTAVTVRPTLPFSSGVRAVSVQSFQGDGRAPVQQDGVLDSGGAFNPVSTSAPPPPADGTPPLNPSPGPNGGGGQGGGGQGNGPNPPQPPPGGGPGGGQGPGNQDPGNQGGGNQGSENQATVAPVEFNALPAQQNLDRPQNSVRPDQSAQPERPQGFERPEQPVRPERVERPARVERPERPARPERPERPDRPDRPARPN